MCYLPLPKWCNVIEMNPRFCGDLLHWRWGLDLFRFGGLIHILNYCLVIVARLPLRFWVLYAGLFRSIFRHLWHVGHFLRFLLIEVDRVRGRESRVSLAISW